MIRQHISSIGNTVSTEIVLFSKKEMASVFLFKTICG